MVLTVQIFQIVFYIIAILFMITLMFIGIWSFITFNKMYKNQRIQNFLLDKIYQSLSSINLNATYSQEKSETIEDEFNVDEFINEDELFDDEDDSNSNTDNIISF